MVMLLTLLTPEMLLLQLLNVRAVMDSTALPGAVGLLVTEAVKFAAEQVTPLPLASRKVAVVPEASPADRVSPTETLVPPRAETVSTPPVSALAGPAAASAVTRPMAAAAPR